MALTGLHPTDYETALKAFITSKEDSKTHVHTDGVGVPTIGAGYALTSHSGTWTTDFATAGIMTR
jgi:GH24 family phage-related lysozyme (muramidase)